MTSPLLSGSAAALLTKASKRLQAFPTSTLLLAVLACAVEEIEAILAQSATIPAPAPTVEAPAELSPEEHLRAALASLEAAIKGFPPGPAVYALEYNALDLRAALAAIETARTLEAA